MIDPRDVAAAAAAVISAPGHDGRTYVLTGPEAITYDEVAAELSAATGREVEFVDVPDEGARQGMLQAGLPGFVAEAIVNVFAQARQGAAERVTATIESLTGRPAARLRLLRARPRRAVRARRGGSGAMSDAATLEANKALIRRVFEDVIPAGDPTAMRDLMAQDFLDHNPLPGQPAGAQGGEYVVSTMHTAHPDLRFSIDDLVAEADRVTIRWTLRGTNTGPLLGRPPSGEPVERRRS